MPTHVHAVIDTVRVVLRDTVVVRDTLTRLQTNASPSWIVPAITATATLTAALLAQWCAVLFGRWERARHAIVRLGTDLEAIRDLLKEIERTHTTHASVLAQIDLLCASYAAHERDVVLVPPRIGRPVRLFYAELVGFRETVRLIFQHERGTTDLEGWLSEVPNLRRLCVDAEAAVRVEHYRHLFWFFLRMRWRATSEWDLRQHMKMTRDIDRMRDLINKEDETL